MSYKVLIPEPTEDQKEYVAALIRWREESYQPELVIGGPKNDPKIPKVG